MRLKRCVCMPDLLGGRASVRLTVSWTGRVPRARAERARLATSHAAVATLRTHQQSDEWRAVRRVHACCRSSQISICGALDLPDKARRDRVVVLSRTFVGDLAEGSSGASVIADVQCDCALEVERGLSRWTRVFCAV